MRECVRTRMCVCYSQNGPRLEVLLVHSLGLSDLEDLRVAQVLQASFKLVQRVRLVRQSTSDLFPHHLHHLQHAQTEINSFY